MPNRLPESTYRLQFHAGFTFRDATAIVPYLHSLGITHCYASPYLKARPGSTHGYDVIDHCSLNPELGTQADYDAWIDAMSRADMSHILDTVPNHVGVGTDDNVWWNDVLEHGPQSKYANFFDIAWTDSPLEELRDKVFLPVLGAPLEEVLKEGELKLVIEDGKRWIRYYDRRFPVSPQTPASENDVASLLHHQHYRLAYWRRASDEINYRRFFDINDLAALRMEREDVFDETHRFTFDLVKSGKVAGLRIDHPDGLLDPEQYLARLRERSPGLYVVVEKILAPDEPLPSEWPVNGTSGYDFLNMVNGLFVDSANEGAFTKVYSDWIGDSTAFEEIVYRKKKLVLEKSFAGDLEMLTNRLVRLAETKFTHEQLKHALAEMIACFPVYRSYVTSRGVHASDVKYVEDALAEAARRNDDANEEVFRLVADGVLQRLPPASSQESVAFAAKFQQLTAPVTAKGVEDTAFYLYNRFVSLNEVGSQPSNFGISPEKLHAYFNDRQAKWPFAMSALSTHDTKRSEDVRARLNVLSEIPDEWTAHVKRWGKLNARHQTNGALDRNEEYLIYQTLLGAWPLEPWAADEYDAFIARVQAYLVKAMREAKGNTSWTDPNASHEAAVTEFVGKILNESTGGEFLADLRPFRQRVSNLGLANSLAQTSLRLAAPGIPDTYQGTELWDFSLVDPDNRRPVDYAKRTAMLDELNRSQPNAAELWQARADGRVKLFVTSQTLKLRRANPGLFSEGTYVPLEVRGKHASRVFTFARTKTGKTAVVIVPRLAATVQDWGDTTVVLPNASEFRNIYTGALVTGTECPVGSLLRAFPVAVLFNS